MRLKGYKALGLRYQRKVGKELRKYYHDSLVAAQWIEFEDINGPGLAQPDFYINIGRIIIFEAKLTQTAEGISQINDLYRPLLQFIYQRPVVGVLVFKNIITPTQFKEISSPLEVMDTQLTCVWHYIG